MVELVYTQHLKCCAARHVGSIPTRTTTCQSRQVCTFYTGGRHDEFSRSGRGI